MSHPSDTQPSISRGVSVVCLAVLMALVGLALAPTAAQAAPRKIGLPIAIEHVDNVRWSDTWGAPRSGGRSHIGVDILGPKMTPLVAVRNATIIWGRFSNTRGSIVRLRDSDGWEYQYIHINNDTPGTDNAKATCEQAYSKRLCGALVRGNFKKGIRVAAGEVIAYLGDSGNAESTTPHLHFEIYKPGPGGVKPTNPTPMVNAARNRLASGPNPQAPKAPNSATKVGHWPDVKAAAEATFLAIEGRTPTSPETSSFMERVEEKGAWSAISEQYQDETAGAELTRMYAALFDRQPDIDGYRWWLKAGNNGLSSRQITAQFVRSREFDDRYRSAGLSQYVDALYRNALGRKPDEAGKNHWVRQVDRGRLTRADLAYEFVRAEESKLKHRPTTELTTLSVVRFGTIPSRSDVRRWSAARASQSLDRSAVAWYGE